jgi:hypothetical protein
MSGLDLATRMRRIAPATWIVFSSVSRIASS